jgi:acyl carrier protein
MADIFDLAAGDLRAESSPDTIPSWDSVQHLSLVLALEAEFGVEIPPEEIEQMRNAGSIVFLIERKLAIRLTGI